MRGPFSLPKFMESLLLGSFGNFHGSGLGGNVHRQQGGDGIWKMAKAANRFAIFVFSAVKKTLRFHRLLLCLCVYLCSSALICG
jgi:hypothetical protein